MTFTVAAVNAGGSTVGSFADPVTIGIYDTATSLLSDPKAVIAGGGVTSNTGILVTSFSGGNLQFTLQFNSGSDSEQVSIFDSSFTAGSTYPGAIGNVGGPGFQVKGLNSVFFTQDANGDSNPAGYPPLFDTLYAPGLSGPNISDALPDTGSNGVTGSAAYAVTNYSAGYAFGGASVVPNLWVRKANSTSNPTVNFEVIFDYGVTTPLSDYDNPRPASDTVFSGSQAVISTGLVNISGGSLVGGYQPFQPFMQGGQVILRVWATGSTSPSNPVSLVYSGPTTTTMSSISIPYSNLNTLPVKAFFNGVTIMPDNAPETLSYVIKNQYSNGLTQVAFQIPNNPAPNSQYWIVSSATSSLAGFNATVASQPSASGPGSIVVASAGTTFAANTSVTITLNVTVTDKTASNWQFPLLNALTTTGASAPLDPTVPTVQTLGVPSSPQSFTAVPANFTGAGGQITLSWAQPATLEGATQYILTGAAGGPQTIAGIGTTTYTDPTAVNLTGYTYSMVAVNAVTQSAAANFGPVTAFANPVPPGPVTALSGGTSVQLNWATPIAVPGSYPVTGYQIYRGTTPGAESSTPIASVGLVTTYNDAGASVSGANYYYYLSSIDSQYSSGPTMGAHDSGPSAEVTGFPPGNPPNSLATTLVNTSPATLQVSWTPPLSNLTAPVSYLISRAVTTGASNPYTVVGVSGPPVTFLDSAVTAGSYYTYTVAGIDGAGVTTNPTNPVPGYVGPQAPATLTATGNVSNVTLTWSAVPNQGAEVVASYTIYQNGVSIGSVPSGTLTFVDSSPVQGTNYNYQVSSVDTFSIEGGKSTPAVQSALLPLIPQSFGVTVQQTGVSFNMDLNWTAPVSSPNVTQYNIRINPVNNNIFDVKYSSLLASVPSSYTQPYVNPQALAAAGTTIFYGIRALDPGGTGPITVVGLQIPPNPPVIGMPSPSSSAVTVKWTARPPAENVSVYNVYRIPLPAGTPVVAGTATPGTAASFADQGGTSGVTYAYYVTATDPGGGAGVPGGESLPSLSVTTGLAPPAPASFSVAAAPNPRTNVILNWTAPVPSGGVTGYAIYSNTINSLPGSPLTLVSGLGPVTDTTLTPASAGQTIYYFIQAENTFGAGAVSMQALQIPPNAPTPVTASSTASTITVNWAAVSGESVSIYSIYRSQLPGGPTNQPQGTVPFGTNTFNDPTATSGVTYYYNVTATNPGGGAGIPGGESLMSANVTMGLAPQTPAGFAAVTIDTSNDISVTWTNVLGADPNATSVSLLVNTSNAPSSATTVNITPTSAVSFFDNGVFSGGVTGEAPDTTYYYWLQSANFFSKSALAGPVTQLTYPAAVSLALAVLDPDGTSRDLTWGTVGLGDVTQYNIYREQLGASSFVSVGFVPAAGLTFPVKRTSPVLPGKQYIYKITAMNATGEGTNNNFVTVGVPPSAPSSVTAVSGTSNLGVTVNLSWSDPTTLSEGVTGFTVYKSTAPAGPFSAAVSGLTGLTYSDSGAGVTGTGVYYYIVAAENNAGDESKWTAANAVAVTAFALPNPATGVGALEGNRQAAVSWTAPANTTYPVSIYGVYHVSSGVTQAASPASTAAVSLTDTGLTNGNSYFYLIQTVDAKGNLSPYSAPSSTVEPVSPPGVPGSVASTNGNQAVQITWNSSVPGTLPLGEYLIEKIDPTGPATTYIPVAPNLTGYVDNTGSNGTTFIYRVEAVDSNSGGVTTGVHVSGFSGPVTGVTGLFLVNPPGNVAIFPGAASASITWTDSFTGGGGPVTGYQVFRAQVPGAYAFLTSVAAGPQSLLDSPLSNGVTYSYYFVAYVAGTASAHSATVFAVPAPPPAAPTPIAATDGVSQVGLAWTASLPFGPVTISQYLLNQAVLPGASSPLTALAGNVTAFTNTGLSAGSTVVYTIAAVNSNGTTGVASSPVTGYPYTPFPPTGFVSLAGSNAVTFNFGPPGSPAWPITRYNLVRTDLSGGSPATFTSPTTPITDATAAQGQLYIYTLTATDSKNHTSVAAGPVTDGPANPPAAPATLIATAGDQQILLDWPAATTVTGGLPVSEYQVTRSDSGGTSVFLTTQTSYLDTSVTNGSPVTYSVQAVDITDQTSGNHISVGTVPVSATGNTANLNPPTGLTATAVSSKAVSLAWTRPNDMGGIVSYYNLYRSTSSFNGPFTGPVSINNPSLPQVTTYTDNNVSPNTTYYYVIRAFYALVPAPASPGESPNSNHASATTPKPVTTPPPVTVNQMGFDANLLLPLKGQKLGIYYVTPNTGGVEIDIYNISGNVIKYLYPGVATANTQTLTTWDGTDRNGNVVASGVYFVEIKARGFHQVKKVAVVK